MWETQDSRHPELSSQCLAAVFSVILINFNKIKVLNFI